MPSPKPQSPGGMRTPPNRGESHEQVALAMLLVAEGDKRTSKSTDASFPELRVASSLPCSGRDAVCIFSNALVDAL